MSMHLPKLETNFFFYPTAFLHAKRICHRNISSSGIRIRKNQGNLQCCIADFSLSRIFSGHDSLATNLANEFRDARYLPPEGFETLNEDEYLSKQMDIYALGLVFWELSRRCQDLYQGVAVPPFELAYQIGNTYKRVHWRSKCGAFPH